MCWARFFFLSGHREQTKKLRGNKLWLSIFFLKQNFHIHFFCNWVGSLVSTEFPGPRAIQREAKPSLPRAAVGEVSDISR
jgi:hypothetical protein